MKLGEALSLRAKQAQKMNDLKGRIKKNALVQEGTQPAEDPRLLLDEYMQLSDDHGDLVLRVALTNVTASVDGVPLVKLLQDREKLIRRRNMYNFAADAATSNDMTRYLRSELTFITTLNVVDLRTMEDDLNEQIRVLDAQIQQFNWQTDLL